MKHSNESMSKYDFRGLMLLDVSISLWNALFVSS